MSNIGEVFTTSHGSCEVVSYENCDKVTVLFKDTGYTTITTAGNLRKGLVKDYLKPSVYGRGYNSMGKLPSKKINPLVHEAYSKWLKILMRCYCPDFLDKNPTYSGCQVDPCWLDFKEFYTWYVRVRKPFATSKWNIDKDLLSNYHVKVYSPETCELVPPWINRLVTGYRYSQKYHTTQGVEKRGSDGQYRAYCNDINGKRVSLGTFKTEDAAFLAYKNFKDSVVRSAALRDKPLLSERLFERLINWNTEIKI